MATWWESARNAREPGEPYCTNCEYDLTGLTESSRCPECGKPLVDVLGRRGSQAVATGYRFKSRLRLFGLPVIHVARGPWGREQSGRARGIIAIGDVATGVLACGGVARGLFALGGVAIGAIAVGGFSLGVLSIAGLAIGAFAMGGGAGGIFASGGGAVGAVAQGGGAAGYIARGGGVSAVHEVTGGPADAPHATAMFDAFSWFFGTWPNLHGSMYWLLAGAAVAAVALAALLTIAATAVNGSMSDLFEDDTSEQDD